MKTLASCPNVHMKLGGLAMVVNGFDFHENVLPPSSGELADAWRPCMEACIEAFGADRCMFESNFPVGQRDVLVSGAVERVQADRCGGVERREGRVVPRHRGSVLPAGVVKGGREGPLTDPLRFYHSAGSDTRAAALRAARAASAAARRSSNLARRRCGFGCTSLLS